MFVENIKDAILKYSNSHEFVDFFLLFYRKHVDYYVNNSEDENEKKEIIERYENKEALDKEDIDLITSCKILSDRKHSEQFIMIFVDCFYHGHQDFDSDVCDVYRKYTDNGELESVYNEALNDAKSGGLSDTAAKIYADGLIKFYNYSESYVRKRAGNYDYAYNKAINNQKSRYYAEIFAQKMSEREEHENREKYCAFYAATSERLLEMKQFKNDDERQLFMYELEHGESGHDFFYEYAYGWDPDKHDFDLKELMQSEFNDVLIEVTVESLF
jgi:hypothetical protein